MENCLPSHADQVANIHKLAYLRDHFSACLPVDQLSMFYAAQIIANEHCLVATRHDEVIGFIIAGYGTKTATAAFVRRHRWQLLQSLLRNPRFLPSKVRSVFLGRLRGQTGYTSPIALRLLSIAVHPGHQGQGVARTLLSHLDRRLMMQGITAYGLSARRTNTGAIAVYERAGFIKETEFLETVYYQKELPLRLGVKRARREVFDDSVFK